MDWKFVVHSWDPRGSTKLWPFICKKTDIGDSDIWQSMYDCQEGDKVSILQEALLALGLAWMDAEYLTKPPRPQWETNAEPTAL